MSDLERKIEKLIKDQILITESEAQDLATLIYNLPEIKGGRVGAVVSPDFWRTFTRKLTKEYETVCINSRLAQNGLANGDYLLVKRVLEPIIDALIKTEQELDSQAKNSG